MFFDVLEVVDKYEMDEDDRLEFKAHLLRLFFEYDIDPCGLEEDPVIGPIYARLEQMES